MLGLRFCARAFYSCGKRGPLFIAMRRPLTIAASLVVEQRLQTRRLSSCGSRAQLLRGMWDLPRPGLEPVSPASAGRFSTTTPPGKPYSIFLDSVLPSNFCRAHIVLRASKLSNEPSLLEISSATCWNLLQSSFTMSFFFFLISNFQFHLLKNIFILPKLHQILREKTIPTKQNKDKK